MTSQISRNALVRQGIRRYLEMAGDIQVVAEASSGLEVLSLLEERAAAPDIVRRDIRMPEMDGLEAASRIHQRYCSVGVIMLTAYDDRQFVVEAVRAGALGYVLKARDAEHLIRTIRLVAAGTMVLDPQIVADLAAELRAADGPEGTGAILSSRELEILQLLAFGHTNRDIAERMVLSPEAVRTHVEHIFQKLGISGRTAAVAEALRRNLVE